MVVELVCEELDLVDVLPELDESLEELVVVGAAWLLPPEEVGAAGVAPFSGSSLGVEDGAAFACVDWATIIIKWGSSFR